MKVGNSNSKELRNVLWKKNSKKLGKKVCEKCSKELS